MHLCVILSNSRCATLLKQEENLSGETERNAKTQGCIRRKEFKKVFASRSSSRLCADITPSARAIS